MKESVFQSEITRSFSELMKNEVHYYKIPSPQITRGSETTFKRYPVYRPYDCYAYKYPMFIAMELKMHCKLSSFGFDKVKDYQVEGLQSVQADGKGKGLFLINIRANEIPERQVEKYGFKFINIVFVIPVERWVKLYDEFDDRQSVPFQWFLDKAFRLNRIALNNNYGWDVRQLFD